MASHAQAANAKRQADQTARWEEERKEKQVPHVSPPVPLDSQPALQLLKMAEEKAKEAEAGWEAMNEEHDFDHMRPLIAAHKGKATVSENPRHVVPI